MQKQIHVNSYVKKDGTQVREHFRNIDTDYCGIPPIFPESTQIPSRDEQNHSPVINMEESGSVLHGGVSVNVGDGIEGILDGIGSVLGAIVSIGLELAPIVMQINQASVIGNNQSITHLKFQFNVKIKQLDYKIIQMKTNIDNTIKKLVTATSQLEYSKIYEQLQKDWQTYQHTKSVVDRIKAYANNDDYKSVVNELSNFVNKSSADKSIITNMTQNSSKISNAENIDNFFKNGVNAAIPKYNNVPILSKYFSDLTINNLARFANNTLNISRPEARQLMDLSLDFPKDTYSDSKYSVIQPIFNEKLNKYLRKIGTDLKIDNNMKGIVFNKSSSISQKLSNFEQLQNDIRVKYNQNIKFISGLGINNDTNLQYSVGHFTILNPRIEDGIFKGELFDIYDFDWLTLDELNDIKSLIINNLAFVLQFIRLKNYYFLIPIEFRW